MPEEQKVRVQFSGGLPILIMQPIQTMPHRSQFYRGQPYLLQIRYNNFLKNSFYQLDFSKRKVKYEIIYRLANSIDFTWYDLNKIVILMKNDWKIIG